MCWADSLNPIGMPPDRSRTWSAKRAEVVEQRRPVGERGRARRPACPRAGPAPRRSGPTTLAPGRWPPVPVLAPWPQLEVERLHLGRGTSYVPAEAGRRQLVEVAGALGLLLGQHAALAGADAGARQLGAAGERGLGLLRQRAEAHVGHEDRDVEPQRLVGVRARCTPRCRPARRRAAGSGASCAVTNWRSSHVGSSVAGHAHRGDRRRGAVSDSPLRGQLVDLGDERLLDGVQVRVVEEPWSRSEVDALLGAHRCGTRPARPCPRAPSPSTHVAA